MIPNRSWMILDFRAVLNGAVWVVSPPVYVRATLANAASERPALLDAPPGETADDRKAPLDAATPPLPPLPSGARGRGGLDGRFPLLPPGSAASVPGPPSGTPGPAAAARTHADFRKFSRRSGAQESLRGARNRGGASCRRVKRKRRDRAFDVSSGRDFSRRPAIFRVGPKFFASARDFSRRPAIFSRRPANFSRRPARRFDRRRAGARRADC